MSKTKPTHQELLNQITDPTAFLAERGVNDWNWAIFGDGSGTTWNKACAWASVAVQRRTGFARVFAGAANAGTVNVAETLAYAQPFLWIGEREGLIGEHPAPVPVRIAVVSDSEYVVKSRNGDCKANPVHALLDEIVKRIERRGGIFEWLHLRRITHPNNTVADGICGLLRKGMPKELDWETSLKKV